MRSPLAPLCSWSRFLFGAETTKLVCFQPNWTNCFLKNQKPSTARMPEQMRKLMKKHLMKPRHLPRAVARTPSWGWKVISCDKTIQPSSFVCMRALYFNAVEEGKYDHNEANSLHFLVFLPEQLDSYEKVKIVILTMNPRSHPHRFHEHWYQPSTYRCPERSVLYGTYGQIHRYRGHIQ